MEGDLQSFIPVTLKIKQAILTRVQISHCFVEINATTKNIVWFSWCTNIRTHINKGRGLNIALLHNYQWLQHTWSPKWPNTILICANIEASSCCTSSLHFRAQIVAWYHEWKLKISIILHTTNNTWISAWLLTNGHSKLFLLNESGGFCCQAI